MASFQWANDVNPVTLAPNFIVPNENKPNLTNVSHLDSVPIIDMNLHDEVLVQEISRACQEFGFFQLINHNVSKELCHSVLNVITEFFHLPHEEKTHLVSTEHMEDGKFFKYYIKDQETKEKIFMWGEAFFHTWHPVDASYIHNLPEGQPHYREVVAAYVNGVGSLITRVLSLISKGLGLHKDYLLKRLGDSPICTAQANYYPPCPEPELTLGLRDHTDFSILTVLLQEEGVTGLQVSKDGKWVAVDPVPGALVVNVADQLQVLSNDRYKSVRHRAVTNDSKKRVSFAMFVGPNVHDTVSPIEELVDEHHPPLYRKYTFGEFIKEFRKQEGNTRMVKEVFRICH